MVSTIQERQLVLVHRSHLAKLLLHTPIQQPLFMPDARACLDSEVWSVRQLQWLHHRDQEWVTNNIVCHKGTSRRIDL